MAEHRVRMLGAGLRRYEDPADSSDPRIRELVVALGTLEPAPAPRPHFRAELRAQLVAVAPRLVAEGPAVELRAAAEPAGAAPTRRGATRRGASVAALRRPLAIVVGAVAVFALVLGGAVWVSKKALPGDALYALKRANENVQLSMTHGTDRGRTYLQFASRRADEVQQLLSHASALALGDGPTAGAGISAHTADLVRSTLDSADDDVRNGTSTLTGQAVHDRSAGPLAIVVGWAPGQVAELRQITDRLPAGPLRARAAESAQLVEAALARANALKGTLNCASLGGSGTDAFGPIPPATCTTPSAPTPGTPGVPSAPVPGRGSTSPKPGSATGHGSGGTVAPGGTAVPGGTVVPGATGSSGGSSAAGGTPIGPAAPSLPLPGLGGSSSSAPAPITISSCGVSVSLGPLGLGLGSCPTT